MPKIGVTKATKSFTITMSHLAWLDEYCIKTGKKMSAVIDELINEKRRHLEAKANTTFWCTSCGTETDRELMDNKPVCVECKSVDNALLHARKMFQL